MARTCAVSSIAASTPHDFFSDQHTSGVSAKGGENAKCNTAVREPAAKRACNTASKQSRPAASTKRRLRTLVCSSSRNAYKSEFFSTGRFVDAAVLRDPAIVNAVQAIAGSQSTATAGHVAPGKVSVPAATVDRNDYRIPRRNERRSPPSTVAAQMATSSEVAAAVDKSSGRCIPPARRRHANRIAKPPSSIRPLQAAFRATEAGIAEVRRCPLVEKSRSACMSMTKLRSLMIYRDCGAITLPRRPSPPLRQAPRRDECFPK